jgi:glycosyltransferase involved in cell wall biosynthesis
MILTLVGSLDREAFDVSLAALEKKIVKNDQLVTAAQAAGIPATKIACSGRLDWRAVRTLRQLVEEFGIDLIHCHEPKSRIYGLLVSALTGVPLVTTNHNWTRQDLRTRLVEYVDACALRFCARSVAVSSLVAEAMRRCFVPSPRISVIPNGIDLSRFQVVQADDSLRASLGIPAGLPVVGSVGRLDIVKGHELLLDAASLTRQQGHDAAYLIVGEGVESENLRRRALDLGLADRVFFAGYQADVRKFVSIMDVFVQPSRREGTPMALLEAMAMQKAVVATPVGGVPFVVNSGTNGILLSSRTPGRLAQALSQLLGDRALRSRLGKTAALHVQREYSARSMAQRYEALYWSVLGRERWTDGARTRLPERSQPARETR